MVLIIITPLPCLPFQVFSSITRTYQQLRDTYREAQNIDMDFFSETERHTNSEKATTLDDEISAVGSVQPKDSLLAAVASATNSSVNSGSNISYSKKKPPTSTTVVTPASTDAITAANRGTKAITAAPEVPDLVQIVVTPFSPAGMTSLPPSTRENAAAHDSMECSLSDVTNGDGLWEKPKVRFVNTP